MVSDDVTRAQTEPGGTAGVTTGPDLSAGSQPPAERPKPVPLTRRERRRRIVILVLLLLVLLLLGAAAWYWQSNRSVPVPQLGEAEDVIAPEYLFSITGTGSDELIRPVGVDVAADGRVYVVDFGRRRVSVFTRTGDFLFAFNEAEDGPMLSPVHLQVQGDEVWVTDRRAKRLYVFDLEGNFLRTFLPANEDDFEWTPLALAFDDASRLFVSEVGTVGKHQVMYFSAEGSRTVTIGKEETVSSSQGSPGAFFFPNGIAVSADDEVFVADSNNRRVQVFDRTGTFSRVVDTSGIPRGLAIDDEERLYVVDALAHMVDIYKLDGTHYVSFGTRGFGPGQFNYPNDVALDGRGRIYVSDRENNQVQVWQWPAVIVPAVVVPDTNWEWSLCALPFLPLLLLPFLRRKTYVLTPGFLTELVANNRTDVLHRRRVRFIAPERDKPIYQEFEAFDSELKKVIHFKEYSESDAAAIQARLRSTEEQAVYLTMAERSRALLTEDVELLRLAVTARVRAFTVAEFLQEIGATKR